MMFFLYYWSTYFKLLTEIILPNCDGSHKDGTFDMPIYQKCNRDALIFFSSILLFKQNVQVRWGNYLSR
jgi:hypothetical protein